jgi:tetratricopeptide (TPR) repeat protein
MQLGIIWYYKALEIYEKTLGLQHPDTVATYINITNVYEAMGKHKEAKEFRRKAEGLF